MVSAAAEVQYCEELSFVKKALEVKLGKEQQMEELQAT